MPDPIVQTLAQRDPNDIMNLARARMAEQMPAETAGLHSFGPMNVMERMLAGSNRAGNIQALTLPFGRVTYDPAQIPQDQSEADDVLAHELTHIGQQQHQSMWDKMTQALSRGGSYYTDPNEKAAYAAEDARRTKRHDITLPKER